MTEKVNNLQDCLKSDGSHVHMIGICGAGMAGLACMLKSLGFKVTGCDASPQQRGDWLQGMGIDVCQGHDAAHIGDDVSWAIRSPAVSCDDAEIKALDERGVSVFLRGQVLPELLTGACSIAVAGTHGKTTTSSFLTHILRVSGREPSWCIGGECDSLPGLAGMTDSELLVVEADESDGTLSLYKPSIAVITNIEHDHFDHFKDEEAFKQCMGEFITNANDLVLYNADDDVVSVLLSDLGSSISGKQMLSFGFSEKADYRACDYVEKSAQSGFVLFHKGEELGEVRVPVGGRHNALNALCAIAVAHSLSLDFCDIAKALESILLPKRRLETVLNRDGAVVISDYAHHPTEIAALVKTAQGMDHSRILAVFQPHRYSRTAHLREEFPPAFDGVGEVILLPVYSASEEVVQGGRISDLYSSWRASGRSAVIAGSINQARDYLEREIQSGDLLLIVGAGDVDSLSDVDPLFTPPEEKLKGLELETSKVSYDEPLSGKTTLKVGGRADIWMDVSSRADLIAILKIARKESVPFCVIGAGSNILVSDLGLRGISARLSGDDFCSIREEEGEVVAGAGVPLSRLLAWMEEKSLTGMEFLAGIPGTVGGALKMNAGAQGEATGNHISWIRCLKMDGSECIVQREDLDIEYRRLGNLDATVAIEAGFSVKPGILEEIQSRKEAILKSREWMRSISSAGSVFKNPSDDVSAGKLIEDAGMKGVRVGGAVVSEAHANIIVTEKGATASDVMALIEIVASEIKLRFGVDLVTEIKVLG